MVIKAAFTVVEFLAIWRSSLPPYSTVYRSASVLANNLLPVPIFRYNRIMLLLLVVVAAPAHHHHPIVHFFLRRSFAYTVNHAAVCSPAWMRV